MVLPISPTTELLALNLTVNPPAKKLETGNYEIKTRKHPKKVSFQSLLVRYYSESKFKAFFENYISSNFIVFHSLLKK